MDGYDYINDYVGLWGYYDIELWLRVHEDSTFEFVNSEDETIYTGTADADKYGMDLYFDDDTPQMRLDLSVSGDLLEEGSSDALHPVDAIVSRATCFEKNGLEINGVVDSSDPIRLDSGVCSFTGKVAKIIKFCSSDLAVTHDVDMVDTRRMQRESPFYADAERYASYSERLTNAAVFLGNNNSLKSLQSFSGSLDDLDENLDAVAHVDDGNPFLHVLFFNSFDNFAHNDYLLLLQRVLINRLFTLERASHHSIIL